MTTPSAIWRPEVGVEFGKRYLYEIADCLPIVPNMPMRKFPMLMAAAVESFIREAQSHGLVSLSEITPEVLVSLIPSKTAICRAVELWQGVDDQMNEDDFCEVMYVHFINDAGNKKKQKLTHRLIAGYLKSEGRVIVRHVGSSTVLSGQLATVVQQDAARLNIPAVKMKGRR